MARALVRHRLDLLHDEHRIAEKAHRASIAPNSQPAQQTLLPATAQCRRSYRRRNCATVSRRRPPPASRAGISVPGSRVRAPQSAGLGDNPEGSHPSDAAPHPHGVVGRHLRPRRGPPGIPQTLRRALPRPVVPQDAPGRGDRWPSPHAHFGNLALRHGLNSGRAERRQTSWRRRQRPEAHGGQRVHGDAVSRHHSEQTQRSR